MQSDCTFSPETAIFTVKDSVRLCVLVAALAAINVVNNQVTIPWYAAVRPAEALLLLGFARWSGLSWAELGLARRTWGRGLRWAGVLFGLVAAAYTAGLLIPAIRPAFLDRRADLTVGEAVWEGTIPVLAGTVFLEEFAFRGVLWALLCRLRGVTFGTVVSSVLFGLWHVLPALRLTADNQAARDVLADNAVAVVFGVVFTALAGVLFCELRRRSGSLLAPIGLHWATNGLGYVSSAIAWRL